MTGFELKFKKDLLSFKETHKLRVTVQKKRVQTNSNVLTSLDFKLKTDEWDKKKKTYLIIIENQSIMKKQPL